MFFIKIIVLIILLFLLLIEILQRKEGEKKQYDIDEFVRTVDIYYCDDSFLLKIGRYNCFDEAIKITAGSAIDALKKAEDIIKRKSLVITYSLETIN